MDREKLSEAAEKSYCDDCSVLYECYDGERELYTEGFVNGAHWYEKQPISERLTDAEKERIMGLVNYVGENAHDSEVRAMRDELKNIFSADLFRAK